MEEEAAVFEVFLDITFTGQVLCEGFKEKVVAAEEDFQK